MDYMASNEKEVFVSAMHKLREFASLGYPVSVRKGACYRVARDGGGLRMARWRKGARCLSWEDRATYLHLHTHTCTPAKRERRA